MHVPRQTRCAAPPNAAKATQHTLNWIFVAALVVVVDNFVVVAAAFALPFTYYERWRERECRKTRKKYGQVNQCSEYNFFPIFSGVNLSIFGCAISHNIFSYLLVYVFFPSFDSFLYLSCWCKFVHDVARTMDEWSERDSEKSNRNDLLNSSKPDTSRCAILVSYDMANEYIFTS